VLLKQLVDWGQTISPGRKLAESLVQKAWMVQGIGNEILRFYQSNLHCSDSV